MTALLLALLSSPAQADELPFLFADDPALLLRAPGADPEAAAMPPGMEPLVPLLEATELELGESLRACLAAPGGRALVSAGGLVHDGDQVWLSDRCVVDQPAVPLDEGLGTTGGTSCGEGCVTWTRGDEGWAIREEGGSLRLVHLAGTAEPPHALLAGLLDAAAEPRRTAALLSVHEAPGAALYLRLAPLVRASHFSGQRMITEAIAHASPEIRQTLWLSGQSVLSQGLWLADLSQAEFEDLGLVLDEEGASAVLGLTERGLALRGDASRVALPELDDPYGAISLSYRGDPLEAIARVDSPPEAKPRERLAAARECGPACTLAVASAPWSYLAGLLTSELGELPERSGIRGFSLLAWSTGEGQTEPWIAVVVATRTPGALKELRAQLEQVIAESAGGNAPLVRFERVGWRRMVVAFGDAPIGQITGWERDEERWELEIGGPEFAEGLGSQSRPLPVDLDAFFNEEGLEIEAELDRDAAALLIELGEAEAEHPAVEVTPLAQLVDPAAQACLAELGRIEEAHYGMLVKGVPELRPPIDEVVADVLPAAQACLEHPEAVPIARQRLGVVWTLQGFEMVRQGRFDEAREALGRGCETGELYACRTRDRLPELPVDLDTLPRADVVGRPVAPGATLVGWDGQALLLPEGEACAPDDADCLSPIAGRVPTLLLPPGVPLRVLLDLRSSGVGTLSLAYASGDALQELPFRLVDPPSGSNTVVRRGEASWVLSPLEGEPVPLPDPEAVTAQQTLPVVIVAPDATVADLVELRVEAWSGWREAVFPLHVEDATE